MKPEPLKNKVEPFDPIIVRPKGYDKGFNFIDIKSAVEWLEKRTHVEDDVRVVDWDYVKEAFEDVTKK